MRFDETEREATREAQRRARSAQKSSDSKKEKKCEQERERRNHVNNLFYKLGELVGRPGVKSKTEILATAKNYLLDAEAKELEAIILDQSLSSEFHE